MALETLYELVIKTKYHDLRCIGEIHHHMSLPRTVGHQSVVPMLVQVVQAGDVTGVEERHVEESP